MFGTIIRKKGIDINILDNNGNTVIQLANNQNKHSLLKLLIMKGGYIKQEYLKEYLQIAKKNRFTIFRF